MNNRGYIQDAINKIKQYQNDRNSRTFKSASQRREEILRKVLGLLEECRYPGQFNIMYLNIALSLMSKLKIGTGTRQISIAVEQQRLGADDSHYVNNEAKIDFRENYAEPEIPLARHGWTFWNSLHFDDVLIEVSRNVIQEINALRQVQVRQEEVQEEKDEQNIEIPAQNAAPLIPPAQRVQVEEKKQHEEDKIGCVICLELLENKSNQREEENKSENSEIVMTECGHLFHDRCLKPWLRNSDECPCCRESVTLLTLTPFKGNVVTHEIVEDISKRRQYGSFSTVLVDIELTRARELKNKLGINELNEDVIELIRHHVTILDKKIKELMLQKEPFLKKILEKQTKITTNRNKADESTLLRWLGKKELARVQVEKLDKEFNAVKFDRSVCIGMLDQIDLKKQEQVAARRRSAGLR